MFVVDNYNYLPGCCWFCRGVHKPILDTEFDLDGVTSPDDPNPSSVTRLYICVECAIEMGRTMAPHRSLEINRLGELAQANRVANELAQRAEDAETRLAQIAGAIAGVPSTVVETAGSTTPGGVDQLTDISHPDAPPLRRRGRPRQVPPAVEEVNTDFLGNL